MKIIEMQVSAVFIHPDNKMRCVRPQVLWKFNAEMPTLHADQAAEVLS